MTVCKHMHLRMDANSHSCWMSSHASDILAYTLIVEPTKHTNSRHIIYFCKLIHFFSGTNLGFTYFRNYIHIGWTYEISFRTHWPLKLVLLCYTSASVCTVVLKLLGLLIWIKQGKNSLSSLGNSSWFVAGPKLMVSYGEKLYWILHIILQ